MGSWEGSNPCFFCRVGCDSDWWTVLGVLCWFAEQRVIPIFFGGFIMNLFRRLHFLPKLSTCTVWHSGEEEGATQT